MSGDSYPSLVSDAMRRALKGDKDAIAAIQADWEPILKQIDAFASTWHNALHERYLAAGACYGDTEEGLQRWFRECMEVEALRAKADQIIEHHLHLARFRGWHRLARQTVKGSPATTTTEDPCQSTTQSS